MEFPKSFLKSLLASRIAFIAGGSLLGFGYYYFIGCTSGTCPITSNPWNSTAYGAVMGALMTFGRKTTTSKQSSETRES
jgi:hypothetical protein